MNNTLENKTLDEKIAHILCDKKINISETYTISEYFDFMLYCFRASLENPNTDDKAARIDEIICYIFDVDYKLSSNSASDPEWGKVKNIRRKFTQEKLDKIKYYISLEIIKQ